MEAYRYPQDPQALLDLAIEWRRYQIAETSGDIRLRSFELWKWAGEYAAKNGLKAPEHPEAYGIYYAPDAEELGELRKLGLL